MPKRGAPICKVVCFNADKIDALKERLPGPDELQAEADRHKAIGHPARMAILYVLAVEECCVCDLANILVQPVSTVSQHLRTLKLAGLVRSRQQGKLVFYSLARQEMMGSLQKIRSRGRSKVQGTC